MQSSEIKDKRKKSKAKIGKKNHSSSDDYSIIKGRSMCINCKHELSPLDLVPVLSWVALKGRCRYCKKLISWQYPLVEISTAALFVLSYIFWPVELSGLTIANFGLWLIFLIGFMALVVYDIRWMLLPNKIIFFLYGIAIIKMVIIIFDQKSLSSIIEPALGVLVGGGLFYVLFQVSKGRWIGGGDVKLGFLLGAVIGNGSLTMLMLFFASLLGCLYSLPLLATKKAGKATRIPFGPFLIAATIIVVLFGTRMVDKYFEIIISNSY